MPAAGDENMMELPQRIVRFGNVALDISNHRLTVDCEIRELEPKAFRLLCFLATNPGRTVTKNEILTIVWDDTAVTDNALTRAVAQVRKALGDDPKEPQFIETVPTVGYRFIAAAQASPLVEQTTPVALPPLARSRSFRQPALWTASALLIGAAVFLATRKAPDEPPAEAVPFTTYQGSEIRPSFSPDGSQVAFSWDGPKQDNFDIYIKIPGSEVPFRLTSDPAFDLSPRWSPDGRTVAFLRILPSSRLAVILIPALGGQERTLATFRSVRRDAFGGGINNAALPGLSWSPDGKWLAAPGIVESAGIADRIWLVSVETGELHPITTPPEGSFGDMDPAFSPDGTAIVFGRTDGNQNAKFLLRQQLRSDATPDGPPIELSGGELLPSSPAWTPDGKEILFATNSRRSKRPAYRVSALGKSTPVPIPQLGTGISALALSRTGNRIVWAQGAIDPNIWRVDLTGLNSQEVVAREKFASSTSREAFPQYSPDGSQIAFYSNRGGHIQQVWICRADGSLPMQLTTMRADLNGTPRWSPDGKTISFDSSQAGGAYQVFTVSSNGGRPKQLTTVDVNYASNWSRDGRWIYFASTHAGTTNVWKTPAGGGARVQVTENGGAAATESPDGKTLYYNKPVGTGSLWSRSVEGGAETKLLDSLFRFNYAVTAKGIYYTPFPGPDGTTTVNYLDLATGKSRVLFRIGVPDHGLAVSPDGRYLLFTQIDSGGSDLMMLDNFK